jgi:glutamine amidotransferase
MCRFIAYLGEPILAEDLLTKPKNSLIHQSYHAEESTEPLNGDGFGMGWYVKAVREEPGLFRSITPAWNNQNLKINAGIIKSNCFLAHIRAATMGTVALENSHPFQYKQYLMMHNGGIPGFIDIKRDIINRLSNHFYTWIKGQTDSEHVFALFMQNVSNNSNGKEGSEIGLDVLTENFKITFEQIEELKAMRGIKKPSTYNMVISDGRRLIATRYSSDPHNESRTLYYAKGKKYECDGNICRMIPESENPKSMLVVSEKLDEFVDEWIPIPDNYALRIEEDLSHSLAVLN